jgi:hypothetical protein
VAGITDNEGEGGARMRTVVCYVAGYAVCVAAMSLSIMHLTGPNGINALALVVFTISSIAGIILTLNAVVRAIRHSLALRRQANP